MSWSASVTGRPGDVLEKFSKTAKESWGYTHSQGDKAAIDAALVYLQDRVAYYGGNLVPTTLLKLEGSGHWDDTSGSGNAMVTVNVFGDRRRS